MNDPSVFPRIWAKLAYFERNGSVVKIVDAYWQPVVIFNARYCVAVQYTLLSGLGRQPPKDSAVFRDSVVITLAGCSQPVSVRLIPYTRDQSPEMDTVDKVYENLMRVIEGAMAFADGAAKMGEEVVQGKAMELAKPSSSMVVCTRNELGGIEPLNPDDWDKLIEMDEKKTKK